MVPENIHTTPMEEICHMTHHLSNFSKSAPKVYPRSPLEFPKFSHTPWKYCYLLSTTFITSGGQVPKTTLQLASNPTPKRWNHPPGGIHNQATRHIASPWDHRVYEKEGEQIDKYLPSFEEGDWKTMGY